jgi:hypothetical protein
LTGIPSFAFVDIHGWERKGGKEYRLKSRYEFLFYNNVCFRRRRHNQNSYALHFVKRNAAGVKSDPGLPDFSWYNIPKWLKIYQKATKYTKRQTI